MTKKAEDKEPEEALTKTCFVMMPISDADGYPTGHFAEVYQQLILPAVTDAGYSCELATSTSAAHMIQLEIVTKAATADLCICDLSTNNANVLFEYGIRQAFDKPTVLIRDDKTRRLFDLSGFRDIEYDASLRIASTLASRVKISQAIEDTVAGADDEGQIFSLVKLMQLTKAALPTGEVSKDDARFALLERKLDAIQSSLVASAGVSIPGTISSSDGVLAVVKITSSTSAEIFSNGARIRTAKGTTRIFDNVRDLEASDIWQALPPSYQSRIREELKKHANDYMPF